MARPVAAALDALCALALAALLAQSSGEYFARRAAVAFAVGRAGTVWRGPVPMVLGDVGGLAYGLPFAVLLVCLTEPFDGSTPGKRLLRLRVLRPDAGAAPPRALLLRAALRTGPWLLAALGLVAGRPEAVLAAGALVLVTWAGSLPALGPGGRALHDRLAGTRVLRMNARTPSPGPT